MRQLGSSKVVKSGPRAAKSGQKQPMSSKEYIANYNMFIDVLSACSNTVLVLTYEEDDEAES